MIWLSPQIFEWDAAMDGYKGFNNESWHRSYEIWSHAKHLLETPSTAFTRIDAITTLKRAIDHRLRLLDDIYKFRRIPIKDKPSEYLDLLK